MSLQGIDAPFYVPDVLPGANQQKHAGLHPEVEEVSLPFMSTL